MLKSPSNEHMPDLLSRRILLAKTLHIPAILLGLSSAVLTEDDESIEAKAPKSEVEEVIVPTQTMAFYERMLALSWEFYYTSSVERAAEHVDATFKLLTDEAKGTSGVRKDQYDAMRCRFYQISSVVSRDALETEKALNEMHEAVAIAFRLRNAELIASSLLRRARIYIQKGEYRLAFKDAQDTLVYVDAGIVRDPLRGKCYQMAGETQAYLAGENKALQEKSLAFFHKAGQIARKGNLEPDGSFVKTDVTSIYIERAKALRLFRRFNEAYNAFAIARKNLSPELTRWQMNLLIEEAKTYFAERNVTDCCLTLLDALKVVRALKMENREKLICRLLEECRRMEPTNTAAERLARALNSKATTS